MSSSIPAVGSNNAVNVNVPVTELLTTAPSSSFNRPIGSFAFNTNTRLLYQAVNNTSSSTGVQTTWVQQRSLTTGTSAAMTAGAVTVASTAVTANSFIIATPAVLGTVTEPQAVYVSSRSAGVSFTLTSASNTDTSTWNWAIFN